MTIKALGRGRRSVMMIEDLNTRKRQTLLRGLYGFFLMGSSIFLMSIDPVQTITDWYLRMEKDSFVFNTWREVPYQLHLKVHVFNYTNVADFLSGRHDKLKVEEVGPFLFQEKRTNMNMSIDSDRQVMSMTPNITLTFEPDLSVAHMKDVRVIVPNLALIALSTLAADKLPWWSNQLAYSLIRSFGSELFLNLTVEEYLWGYKDPLVSIASTVAPGWIDFGSIGILDRFYAHKDVTMEVDLSDKDKKKYSVLSYDGSPGMVEQGYKDINTSNPCNLIEGTYEGLMLNPGVTKDFVFKLFRKQACRIYPFHFHHEDFMSSGLRYYRFGLDQTAFNTSSEFACQCSGPCLPDGFVDISKCFYNFPMSLTKPHYMDVDPREIEKYEGLEPDREAHSTYMDFEPVLGIPVKLQSSLQANIAVRTSSYNPITKPLDKHILPLIWFTMFCYELPSNIDFLLRLRVLYAPPTVVVFESALILLGIWLVVSSLHRYFNRTNIIPVEIDEKSHDFEKITDVLL